MSGQATRKVTVQYHAQSEVAASGDGSRLLFALDGRRGAVGIRGTVKQPALFRDALSTLAGILGSDLRYRHRDRAQYLAYLAKQGKKATKEIWEAQKAYLDEQLGGEQKKSAVLDPILSVHPDEVSLEVFSRDESCYARLAFSNEMFEGREAAHGTTYVDLNEKVADSLDRVRTYQPLRFEAGIGPSGVQTAEPRDLDIPYAWLRGFLQVQSAATLPAATCEIEPIDLYNLLFALRARKAKTSPRALRFELIPGQPPRMVLEPWETVLESHGAPYTGKVPRVVRTFGRQRLLALAKILPHVKSVRAQLLGGGLPLFWVMDLGAASLSLGLTGWTESGWSSAAAFDALMPGAGAAPLAAKVRGLLDRNGPMAFEQLTKELAAKPEDVRAALQLECLRGQLLFDFAKKTFRPRPLFAEPVEESAIRFGNPREARAHRLLGDGAAGNSVEITKIHEISGEGIEIHGEVNDRESLRKFTPKFLLDLEGRVRDAGCGCPHFKRSGLREGPCEHMIALRLAFARRKAEAEALRKTPEGRKLIHAETRTYTRRSESGEEVVYRVSLDDKLVMVHWGNRVDVPRQQRLWFDSDEDARKAYFARLEELANDGFVDADDASAM